MFMVMARAGEWPPGPGRDGSASMKCPGQDTRYWRAGAIFEARCPKCGAAVEFFKDETKRTCRACGHRFVNPKMDFGCASYCRFAEQCLGDLPPELMAKREDLLKDRAALEMKKHFGRDFKRIAHTLAVVRHAEALLREEGGDPAVVLLAAYLHDTGIPVAKEKCGRPTVHDCEREGAVVARRILEGLGARPDLTSEVCALIAHHHSPGEEESLNFRILYDADTLANLEEALKDPARAEEARAKARFLTEAGRRAAEAI